MNTIRDILYAPPTILIVDDEPSVLAIVEIVLKRAGYRVLSSDDPRQALGYSQIPAERVDLLLTDMVMPELDGTRLAEQFRRNSPRTKVLFMTGHAGRLGLSDRDEVLRKPFRPLDLVAAVERSLSKAASVGAG